MLLERGAGQLSKVSPQPSGSWPDLQAATRGSSSLQGGGRTRSDGCRRGGHSSPKRMRREWGRRAPRPAAQVPPERRLGVSCPRTCLWARPPREERWEMQARLRARGSLHSAPPRPAPPPGPQLPPRPSRGLRSPGPSVPPAAGSLPRPPPPRTPLGRRGWVAEREELLEEGEFRFRSHLHLGPRG